MISAPQWNEDVEKNDGVHIVIKLSKKGTKSKCLLIKFDSKPGTIKCKERGAVISVICEKDSIISYNMLKFIRKNLVKLIESDYNVLSFLLEIK